MVLGNAKSMVLASTGQPYSSSSSVLAVVEQAPQQRRRGALRQADRDLVNLGRYPFGMSDAISNLVGAIVGGLAVMGGAALQVRNVERQRKDETARQEKDRRLVLVRRYLSELGDAVDSLLHRVENWAHRGGPGFAEALHPGYWERSTLYAVARALGAERILALDGVYVELQALCSSDGAKLLPRAVEEAIRQAFE